MTKHSPATKSLRNPLTGECKYVSTHEGTRLHEYGWEYINLSEYKAWQVRQQGYNLGQAIENYRLAGIRLGNWR